VIHVLGTEPNPNKRQAFSKSQTHRTSKADPANKRRRTRECYWMSRNSKEPPGPSPERKETGDPPSAQGSSLSVPTRRSGPPYSSCFWVVDAQKTCVRVWERCVLDKRRMVQKMRPTSRRTPGGSEGLEERRCLWLSKSLSKKNRHETMDKILKK